METTKRVHRTLEQRLADLKEKRTKLEAALKKKTIKTRRNENAVSKFLKGLRGVVLEREWSAKDANPINATEARRYLGLTLTDPDERAAFDLPAIVIGGAGGVP